MGSSVQPVSHVQLFATPWTTACQASLSITNSRSLLKLMSIELVMPSNHLILCHSFPSHLQSFPASGSSQVGKVRFSLYEVNKGTLVAIKQRGNVLWGRVLCVIIITKATNSKSKKQFPTWSQNWLLCNSPRTQRTLIRIKWVQDGRQVNFD